MRQKRQVKAVNTDTAMTIKGTVAATCGALTALWGWFGWLLVALVGCMLLDYVTGSAAALRSGEWSSHAARDGIWHKLGTIVAVLVACILDMTVRLIVQNLTSVTLPFEYEVLFGPMVVIWSILTECGSLIENAAALGAPVPPWLGKVLAVLKDKVDDPVELAGREEKR